MSNEPITCERCKEREADLDTADGRWVCFGCYKAIFDDLMLKRDAKAVVGPATRAVAEAVAAVRADKRRDRQLIVECGGHRHILSGATADAFLAELEAD